MLSIYQFVAVNHFENLLLNKIMWPKIWAVTKRCFYSFSKINIYTMRQNKRIFWWQFILICYLTELDLVSRDSWIMTRFWISKGFKILRYFELFIDNVNKQWKCPLIFISLKFNSLWSLSHTNWLKKVIAKIRKVAAFLEK